MTKQRKKPDREQDMKTEGSEYTIQNCARCGQTHPVTFFKFTNPPVYGDITVEWYGHCPRNNEPILMHSTNVNTKE